IQLELAKGAVNAMLAYGNAGRFDDLEAWGALLREQAGRFPCDAGIQLQLVRGVFNAIAAYGNAGRFDALEAWGKPLRDSLLYLEVKHIWTLAAWSLRQLQDAVAPAPGVLTLVSALVESWPGYQFETSVDGKTLSAPIAMFALQILAGVQATGEAARLVRRCRDRIEPLARLVDEKRRLYLETLQEIREKDKLFDRAVVADLWEHRMYLPDRGDILVPLLEALGMKDQLAEAAADPWRRLADETST
ncbi:hypothetical protein, partial [Maioricimonas sp. JC845]|uniref:hypothetical protein n=1 Tax=Maioricimonas sp. JC845 TaxID=3232138 RepID=UPI0034593D3B